ncbi:Soluble guanylate cyclase gcy-37 [Caenorhabditis elegans]|uniref:Soluble guanylate cyclase gcy-37 n=1 Tax=Caenorhabditis elegans TaxID=6239 RepID=GCY37_CAEEL|nr:Soluble guanylate cyclase gcy-37 [Caenorhabditis elegans]Q6DNF3.1 RecName: Full=Soluble guanylate cyclase gcy-37 [Caenorhabditis elegans]AAT73713.1 guanylate cyclase-like protein [Caenorhabditis elegans]CCD68037.1 Soluble guanylate cyclase gcy-37 [Caenorhabditis elegans]|eukprot:NP_500171.2 Soluble guanylate cyclase gcy-37 [Caenorhabditis elegans]
MIGWTHVCVSALILRKYGPEVLEEILRKAGYQEDIKFDIQCYYDDTETMRIFRVAATVLGLSVDDMWEMYGEFLITHACETGWQKMLFCMANNLQEFLDNLNSMHYFIDQIAFKSEMKGPTFQCEPFGESGLKLHYFSFRQGLFPIVKGLVRKTARTLFEMDVKVCMLERNQERRKSGMVEHVIFSVEPDDNHRKGKRLFHKFRNTKTTENAPSFTLSSTILVGLRDFKNIFPYHVCFNKQMIIEHIGIYLLREYGLENKKTLKVSDLMQLVQPSDIQLTYKNVLSYLNTLFIFQLKHHSKRNEVQEGSSEAFQQPLVLKGEMMPINDGNSIIFICSPHVTTVRDILNLKLYISDMPMHDATRDLVMLNQSRICQMELNKKLEETMKKMKKMTEELEVKKSQTDRLLFEFVPPVIAEALRAAKTVPAQEFSDCSVIFTDIPDFFTISVNCSPTEIITVVTDLFHRFDRIIEKHKGYKVLSLMDSYLIVGGVPNANQYHCEDSLNLALGLLFEAKQVVVPKLERSVRLRIGVHCGPVVAGIVSQQKPRFCVLGNTVNVTKSICSHSSPGKVLVSNAVRTMVTKHLKSIFVFNANGYLELQSGKVLTHFLEKNEKCSVWDIVDRDKATNDSIDGYRELHSDNGTEEWQEATVAAYRVISVVDALENKQSRTRKALTRLRSVKRKFRTIQSNDSGVSVSEPNVESAVCSIM